MIRFVYINRGNPINCNNNRGHAFNKCQIRQSWNSGIIIFSHIVRGPYCFILTALLTCCMSRRLHFQHFQWDFLPCLCEHTHTKNLVYQATHQSQTTHHLSEVVWLQTYSQFNLGISMQMSSNLVRELFNRTLGKHKGVSCICRSKTRFTVNLNKSPWTLNRRPL